MAAKSEKYRIQIALNEKQKERLSSLQSLSDSDSSAQVVRDALRLYDVIMDEAHRGGELLIRKGDDLTSVLLPGVSQDVSPIYYSLSRNKEEIKQYSKAVVQSIQEMNSIFAMLGHNNPPEDIDDEVYSHIRALEAELSELRASLDAENIEKAAKTVVSISGHVNNFLDNFMPIAGKGMAVLVVVSTATLLGKAGIDSGVVSSLLEKALK